VDQRHLAAADRRPAARLPARLRAVRRDPDPPVRKRGPSVGRFGQHWRDQRAAHGEQGARRRHLGARPAQGHGRRAAGAALVRPRRHRRGRSDARPPIPPLAAVPRRQGRGDPARRAAGVASPVSADLRGRLDRRTAAHALFLHRRDARRRERAGGGRSDRPLLARAPAPRAGAARDLAAPRQRRAAARGHRAPRRSAGL
ncbi:MAG: Acyl-phosphate:glycerol-3-phosphate O-acyltransferase PlsY (EC, partial [uncultured Sphingomonadaceae bacterium]